MQAACSRPLPSAQDLRGSSRAEMTQEVEEERDSTRVDGRSRRSGRPPADSGRIPSRPHLLDAPLLSQADTEPLPGTVEEVIDRDMHRRMTAFAPFTMLLIVVVGSSSF